MLSTIRIATCLMLGSTISAAPLPSQSNSINFGGNFADGAFQNIVGVIDKNTATGTQYNGIAMLGDQSMAASQHIAVIDNNNATGTQIDSVLQQGIRGGSLKVASEISNNLAGDNQVIVSGQYQNYRTDSGSTAFSGATADFSNVANGNSAVNQNIFLGTSGNGNGKENDIANMNIISQANSNTALRGQAIGISDTSNAVSRNLNANAVIVNDKAGVQSLGIAQSGDYSNTMNLNSGIAFNKAGLSQISTISSDGSMVVGPAAKQSINANIDLNSAIYQVSAIDASGNGANGQGSIQSISSEIGGGVANYQTNSEKASGNFGSIQGITQMIDQNTAQDQTNSIQGVGNFANLQTLKGIVSQNQA